MDISIFYLRAVLQNRLANAGGGPTEAERLDMARANAEEQMRANREGMHSLEEQMAPLRAGIGTLAQATTLGPLGHTGARATHTGPLSASTHLLPAQNTFLSTSYASFECRFFDVGSRF